MAKPKACRMCGRIFDGLKCPACDSKESTESFKGRVVVLDPEKSEIANKLKIKGKGNFAIKTR